MLVNTIKHDNKQQNKKCRTTHMPPDLELWTSDPKISRGNLLVITNLQLKYEHCDNYIVFKIISRNHFNIQYHLDLWPSDPKTNRDHLLVITKLHVKYANLLFIVFKIISGNHFNIQGHFDLWPSDPKINRDHLLVITNLQWNMQTCYL